MFKISEHNDLLLIEDIQSETTAKINIGEGGRIQELILNGIKLIEDPKGITYEDSFASAFLFPFTNRIENGTYTFNDENYNLIKNEKGKPNALHGLIYNKKFELVNSTNNNAFAKIELRYIQQEREVGFPFQYQVTLIYYLYQNNLKIEFNLENIDKSTFPFAIGWHPYFVSKNLSESTILSDIETELIVNDNGIPTTEEKRQNIDKLNIDNTHFDNAYKMNSNNVVFNSTTYKIKIESSSITNYLQLYTPPNRNYIAIEPMTAPANCFNNLIGIQYLEPNEMYSTSWDVKLEIK